MIEIKHKDTGKVLHTVEGNTLVGANLEGADLVGANLEGADLGGANLVGANLEGANLEEASLEGVNLKGTGVKLTPSPFSVPSGKKTFLSSFFSNIKKFFSGK